MLTILGYARDEAMRTGSYGIGADHIVLGLLRHRDNNACRALAACGIEAQALKEAVDAKVFADRAVPWEERARVRPTRAAAALLGIAAYEMLKYGPPEILSSHLLLALM
ncbi:MAG: Clp protease N-terminal domain-containing protein, partial [Bacteroidales bacterium]|nr:Clp protease N-terminal domain-containing protein [Bacteroidales bacterium]